MKRQGGKIKGEGVRTTKAEKNARSCHLTDAFSLKLQRHTNHGNYFSAIAAWVTRVIWRILGKAYADGDLTTGVHVYAKRKYLLSETAR